MAKACFGIEAAKTRNTRTIRECDILLKVRT
jgi:hypothetical protein